MIRQRGRTGWRYRCFSIVPFEKGWKATSSVPALSPDLPWKFVWTAVEDKTGLQEYIDALLTGSRSRSSEFEEKGFVTSIETYHLDRPDDTRIKVNIRHLVDMLAMRDHISVPLWARLHFVTDGNKLIPRDYVAALAQLAPEHADLFDPKKPWDYASDKKLASMGLAPEDVTSSMNRPKHTAAPVSRPRAAAFGREQDAAPQEVRISLRHFTNYFELITQVRPEDAEPYLTKRIARPDGTLLWCGTSYELQGPWTVYVRNAAELLALGIEL